MKTLISIIAAVIYLISVSALHELAKEAGQWTSLIFTSTLITFTLSYIWMLKNFRDEVEDLVNVKFLQTFVTLSSSIILGVEFIQSLGYLFMDPVQSYGSIFFTTVLSGLYLSIVWATRKGKVKKSIRQLLFMEK